MDEFLTIGGIPAPERVVKGAAWAGCSISLVIGAVDGRRHGLQGQRFGRVGGKVILHFYEDVHNQEQK